MHQMQANIMIFQFLTIEFGRIKVILEKSFQNENIK